MALPASGGGGGNPNPRELAVAIAKAYAESYRHAGVRNITQSALALARLETVAEAAVGKAVLESVAPGRAVARSSGLSLWFPLLSTDYVSRRSEYVALRLCHAHPGWAAFLDRLLAH
jgi:hypothetical protein